MSDDLITAASQTNGLHETQLHSCAPLAYIWQTRGAHTLPLLLRRIQVAAFESERARSSKCVSVRKFFLQQIKQQARCLTISAISTTSCAGTFTDFISDFSISASVTLRAQSIVLCCDIVMRSAVNAIAENGRVLPRDAKTRTRGALCYLRPLARCTRVICSAICHCCCLGNKKQMLLVAVRSRRALFSLWTHACYERPSFKQEQRIPY